MTDTEQGYQALITNIAFDGTPVRSYRGRHEYADQLPRQFTLDLPEAIWSQEGKADYYDVVETFVYNFLTRKFGYEVNCCQIWLPPR